LLDLDIKRKTQYQRANFTSKRNAAEFSHFPTWTVPIGELFLPA
jgi:hypothetical protein